MYVSAVFQAKHEASGYIFSSILKVGTYNKNTNGSAENQSESGEVRSNKISKAKGGLAGKKLIN